jgi:hypothetical protein
MVADNMPTAPVQDRPTVFLSYAREDSGFVRRLAGALADEGVDVAADWALAPGEDYRQRLRAMILGAEALVFIISPDAIGSSACREELKTAVEHNKPILPLSYRDHGDDAQLDSALRSPQWVVLREGGELGAGARELARAVNTDLGLLSTHGQLLIGADEWARSGRARGYLLHRDALRNAEAWLARVSAQPGRLPQPTALETEYILASQQNRARGTRTTLGIAGAVSLAMGILAVVAWLQRERAVTSAAEAERQRVQAVTNEQRAVAESDRANRLADSERKARATADEQRTAAEVARDEAAARLADDLADRAERESAPGRDIVQAFHLALRAAEAIPRGHPSVAIHTARVVHLAAGLPTRVVALADVERELVFGTLSADGRHLLALDRDYEFGLWDVASGLRRPLPFDPRSMVGTPAEVGDPARGREFLEFSRDGARAKAVLDETSLWIWDVDSRRVVGRAEIDLPDDVVFSRDGRAVMALTRDCEGSSRPPKQACCRTVVWSEAGAPPPRELDETCDPDLPDPDEPRRLLLYRGRRPVLVRDLRNRDDLGYDGQFAEPERERWVTFGMTPDLRAVVAVSRNGLVHVWNRDGSPLVRERPTVRGSRPVTSWSLADGSGLLIVTRDGRLLRQRFDGAEVWSAPLVQKSPSYEIDKGTIWETSGGGQILVHYAHAVPGGGDAGGWLELWKLGESRARRTIRFTGPVADLTLQPDATGGVVEIGGDDGSNYLHGWSFTGGIQSTTRAVHIGVHLGLTRDAKISIEGDDREIRLVEPLSGALVVPPLTFGAERGVGGTVAAAILRHAHAVTPTAGGVVATLLSGQRVTIAQERIGARVEIDGRLIRGSGAERGQVLSPDGRFMAALLEYRSGGGRIGASQDLVIREVESGRVLGAHQRFPHWRIAGFTRDARGLLAEATDGRLYEYFVHGGRSEIPPWYADLGIALTGERLLPNFGLSVVDAVELSRRRRALRTTLERSAPDDIEARFVLEHFLVRP